MDSSPLGEYSPTNLPN
jgi:hypothetical protein